MIKEKLSESLENEEAHENVEELVKSMLRMKKAGREPVMLRLRRSAVESVAEGRDRWPT